LFAVQNLFVLYRTSRRWGLRFLGACGGECWKNAFLSAKKSEISDKFIHKNQKSVKKFAG